MTHHKGFCSTLRPKWHHKGGEVAPKMDRMGDGTLVLITKKPKKTGHHCDADYAPHYTAAQAARSERRGVKRMLKKLIDPHDHDYDPRPGVISEANWRGS